MGLASTMRASVSAYASWPAACPAPDASVKPSAKLALSRASFSTASRLVRIVARAASFAGRPEYMDSKARVASVMFRWIAC